MRIRPTRKVYPVPLDKKALPSERLPRTLTIDIFERKVRGQGKAGSLIGQRMPVPLIRFANLRGERPTCGSLPKSLERFDPVNAAFDKGCRRRNSKAAASSFSLDF
jgi:hypothetical protein